MFKKCVGITQRVMRHPRYNETMDCLDINWAKFLISIDILPVPLSLVSANEADELWKTLELDGLILSGGNTLIECADSTDDPASLSPERDAYENALLKSALSTGKPVLGVCRGLQVINTYYNGHLTKVKGHTGTKHRLFVEDSVTTFQIPSEVNSFHDYAVLRKKLGKELIPLAYDAEDNIEAFYHPKDKVLGIMWHPERQNPPLQCDYELIKGHFGL
ncbi:gamma-glutamyl-gamma-aminobutyrate hydrolase family protein [Alphaproteobacteria bacterium]|jgi:N5-(cytidine 5'-diphosphoramidyl)-L-glutamine hydrolase|nr:gamma-glutamyl-gamma-aminobutyrate hydrolase family protein [Alphaproteobacteria bacterium]